MLWRRKALRKSRIMSKSPHHDRLGRAGAAFLGEVGVDVEVEALLDLRPRRRAVDLAVQLPAHAPGLGRVECARPAGRVRRRGPACRHVAVWDTLPDRRDPIGRDVQRSSGHLAALDLDLVVLEVGGGGRMR